MIKKIDPVLDRNVKSKFNRFHIVMKKGGMYMYQVYKIKNNITN